MGGLRLKSENSVEQESVYIDMDLCMNVCFEEGSRDGKCDPLGCPTFNRLRRSVLETTPSLYQSLLTRSLLFLAIEDSSVEPESQN